MLRGEWAVKLRVMIQGPRRRAVLASELVRDLLTEFAAAMTYRRLPRKVHRENLQPIKVVTVNVNGSLTLMPR